MRYGIKGSGTISKWLDKYRCFYGEEGQDKYAQNRDMQTIPYSS
jgi:hypothetical protein